MKQETICGFVFIIAVASNYELSPVKNHYWCLLTAIPQTP